GRRGCGTHDACGPELPGRAGRGGRRHAGRAD
ncbi:MAG: hypothetical protein AVDCRST_MAG64-3970, partial [uncultured Phycisphaerae bacterium]